MDKTKTSLEEENRLLKAKLEKYENRFNTKDVHLEDLIGERTPKKFLSINGHILTQQELLGVMDLISTMRKLKEM